MILSRWDRPGQSAQGSLSRGHAHAWLAGHQCSSDIHESRGAHTCFRMRVSRMVHYGPHQALSDATPIARGNTPLTIPILTTGIGACAKDTDICPTFARNDRNVSPCSSLCCCPVRDSHECTIECAHIHWSENHDLSVLPPFASYFS